MTAEPETQPVTREEMDNYLMFPEAYCRDHEGGRGPLCGPCREREDREYTEGLR